MNTTFGKLVGPGAVALAVAAGAGDRSAAQWVEQEVVEILGVSGPQLNDLFGWLVAPLGDVNGDGVTDFTTCSPFFDAGQASSVGRVSVHSGTDGAQIWARTTALFSAILGFALEPLDDVNGDGVTDVIAGAPWNTGLPGGQAIVYSGTTGAILHIFPGTTEFDTMGHSIATGGDFDGDGTVDIAISAPNLGDGRGSGRVFIHSSGDFGLVCEVSTPGPDAGFQFGTGLAFLGDVDGDGRDDLAAGERLANDGPDGRLLVMSWDGSCAALVYAIEGVYLGASFDGDRIEGGRDYDGDGTPDIFIGNISGTIDAELRSGLDGSLIRPFDGGGEGGGFGAGSMIEDVTGDGRPDLAVGARLNDLGATNGGKVFVYDGWDGSVVRTMTHTVREGRFGAHVRDIPDHDGDGVRDFLVGASGPSIGGLPMGRVYIVAGLPAPCPADVDRTGAVDKADLAAIAAAWGPCPGCAEDIDGDGAVGIADLLRLLRAWGPCG